MKTKIHEFRTKKNNKIMSKTNLFTTIAVTVAFFNLSNAQQDGNANYGNNTYYVIELLFLVFPVVFSLSSWHGA